MLYFHLLPEEILERVIHFCDPVDLFCSLIHVDDTFLRFIPRDLKRLRRLVWRNSDSAIQSVFRLKFYYLEAAKEISIDGYVYLVDYESKEGRMRACRMVDFCTKVAVLYGQNIKTLKINAFQISSLTFEFMARFARCTIKKLFLKVLGIVGKVDEQCLSFIQDVEVLGLFPSNQIFLDKIAKHLGKLHVFYHHSHEFLYQYITPESMQHFGWDSIYGRADFTKFLEGARANLRQIISDGSQKDFYFGRDGQNIENIYVCLNLSKVDGVVLRNIKTLNSLLLIPRLNELSVNIKLDDPNAQFLDIVKKFHFRYLTNLNILNTYDEDPISSDLLSVAENCPLLQSITVISTQNGGAVRKDVMNPNRNDLDFSFPADRSAVAERVLIVISKIQ